MFPNKADNEIAAKDPQPGDYWSEMFCPVCLVVGRKENKVFIYENYKPIDKGYWSWDTEKVSEYDIKDFQSKISHETIDGYWCDVDRNKMKQFVEYYEESLK